MSKRITEEARILAFYDTASLEKVTTVHNIVSSRLKQRLASPESAPTNVPPQVKKRRARRKKSQEDVALAGVATA